jgi:hypothetical protein
MALKLYKSLNKESFSQFKCLALLGSLLDRTGDTGSMKIIHDIIFKQLEHIDCYEKVFATRNYGYLLAKREETRLEGNDFIKKADEMQAFHPYWAERQLGLFTPTLDMVADDLYGI